ncbi:MerR family DNA-binding transcriptional regulator [Aliivibrio logei]|jgi:DNA-binding transcriptional MerR regulator|uniref:MerR family DNA-binding transcriptional regulator n=1 Tax=Aliivibrio logei TaxID=688 RepID=UPI0035C8FE2B
MYRIFELAQHVGLSRSTLLYYEELGLISAKRQANGYRSYLENDLQCLVLFQQLHRLDVLDNEIAKKQTSERASILNACQSSIGRMHLSKVLGK